MIIQTFQDADDVWVPQFRCFATTIQRFVQFPHFIIAQRCVIPFVRFWWLCKQILVNICVQECCVNIDRNCDVFALWVTVFDHVNLRSTLFSETVSMVLVRTSQTEWHPDMGCSPSEPASISHDLFFFFFLSLSLDRPIVFDSLVCQLPQTVPELSWLPFL